MTKIANFLLVSFLSSTAFAQLKSVRNDEFTRLTDPLGTHIEFAEELDAEL